MGKYTLQKTNKELSVEQENYIAKAYGGRRSPSSGAQDADRGDVRYEIDILDVNFRFTGECKATRASSFSLKKETWNKIQQEADEQGRAACMFIRFYDEETGDKLDLVVKDVLDDLEMTRWV